MTTSTPLGGLTVVEIGHTVAAPYAGMVLAELGANVIKVESAGGDYSRDMPPFRDGQVSAVYQSLNRNKRSVVVDLKDAGQTERLRALILAEADVLIHNLKFGAVDALGLGSDRLLAAKPSLVYCNIGAFGHTGPLKHRPGYDPLMQAYSGIMSLMGEDGRPPVRVGVSITDMASGLWAVIGILAACRERQLTGRGGVVDTSLYETALGWLCVQFASFDASGVVPKKEGSGVAMMVPYQAFRTADSFVMVAAGNDNNFRRLCGAIDRTDLAEDVRFVTNKVRVANRAELIAILEPIFAMRTTAEWLARLEAANVPGSPIHGVDHLADDPQAESLGMIQASPDGTARLLGLPVSFDTVRPAFVRMPPALGEHTEELLGRYR
jgi:crotonobetainyl-CoA:carnitine CoA-transferase CaiB-like acyl-CoA transferase